MSQYDSLDARTRSAAPRDRPKEVERAPALTILCHPEADRVGERAVLSDLLSGKSVELSRLSPLFAPQRKGRPRSLADPYLSRQPLLLTTLSGGAVLLDCDNSSTVVLVDGLVSKPKHEITSEQIDQGAVLSLADRIVLVLHWFELLPDISMEASLVGGSSALNRVKYEIERVAEFDFPVLLRGESGTGKELVAKAIHEAGPRRAEPFLALNIGALPKEVAAAELFGAAKGAFTGAHRDRPGFFERAGRGTLFLDEIGIAAPEIQMLLLRVLESGEIQPVGDNPQLAKARVVSATDADLDTASSLGEFHSPLLHRLSTYEIVLPPLRERIEDFGSLFFYFLGRELALMGEEERLSRQNDDQPWVPADLITNLAQLPWPGNVRQLRNVVRQIAVASRGHRHLTLPQRVAEMLDDVGAHVSADSSGHEPEAVRNVPRLRESVSEDELLAALQAESFHLGRTAERLGLSKTSLYRLVDQSPNIRKASELQASEIVDALEQFQGDVDQAAKALAVSSRGLRLRMHKLKFKS